MTEKRIQYLLAAYGSSPVSAWSQALLLPNCSTTPIWWEADLLAVSRAGYCTEVEIKISMADWRIDQKKPKHSSPEFLGLIKKFYYAGPMELMKRHEEVWTRPGCGLIGIEDANPSDPYPHPRIVVLRGAEQMKARKLTQTEMLAMGRCAVLRYWNWAGEQYGALAPKAASAKVGT